MQSVFISTFDLAARMHDDLDEDQEMISPYQFGLLMVDWTNPLRAAEMYVSLFFQSTTYCLLILIFFQRCCGKD